MRMSLNIKNEGTHAAVRELAAATGLTQTAAVDAAVRRMLHEIEQQQPARSVRAERVTELVGAFRQAATPAERKSLHAHDRLYNRHGLYA